MSNDSHGITINRKPKIMLPNQIQLPAIVPNQEIYPASSPCTTKRRIVIICEVEVGKHTNRLLINPIVNFSNE